MIVSKNPVDYEPLPTGLQPAICIAVYDLGLQKGYMDKIQHKLVILWELEARRETDGEHFLATKKYTACLDERATLTADLQSWRGRAFTPEELQGFDLDKILGKPCQLNLVQVTKANGDPFVEVAAVLPPLRGWPGFTPETDPGFVPAWVATAIEHQLEAPDQAAGRSAPGVAPDERAEYMARSGSSGRGAPPTF
ncbi:MAG TPA: hypothetical protein P5298_15045 [Spirochaetia bacterium]|nr:hypothetical protein [Spirochaetia bacterium]